MPPLIGHEAILRELRGLALAESPAHALLLVGPDGSGRRLLAMEYAKLLNCERGAPTAGASLFADAEPAPPGEVPCGLCRPCRLIEEGAHPDVLTLGPGDTLCRPRVSDSSHPGHADSRDIRICQVRGLIDLASRYPFEARWRVVIIDPADRLGETAGHTLLKTLEEPPGHTAFVLITAAPEDIIETIISRCRRIDVRPVPRAAIESALLERGIASAIAVRAAAESRGRPGRALAFAAKPDLMDDRGRLLERCAKLAAGTLAERMEYAGQLAERFRRDRNQFHPELDAWEAFWEGQLRTSTATAGDELARGSLDALKAIAQAREDLLANVMPRPALELMLLTFPRVTMAPTPENEAALHA